MNGLLIFLRVESQVIMSANSITTTISHTFSKYNTLATIYLTGPMSLIFLFRVYRTVRDTVLTSLQKKMILIVVLLTQYTTMIVVRYDTIIGIWHYVFTALTFVLLLIYHNTTHGSCKEEYQEEITVIKTYVSLASVVLMLVFGIAQFVTGIRDMQDWWQVLCIIEVFAVLLLGSLDLVDVYAYGAEIGIE